MKRFFDLIPILIPNLATAETNPAQNYRMFSTSGSGKKPTVRTERRRPAGPGGAKPTGRAEAPVRRRPSQPGSTPQQPISSGYSQPAEDSSYSQPSYGGSSTGSSLPSFPSGGAGGLGGLGSLLGLLGKLPKTVLIIGGIFLCIAVACFAIFILPQLLGRAGRPGRQRQRAGRSDRV